MKKADGLRVIASVVLFQGKCRMTDSLLILLPLFLFLSVLIMIELGYRYALASTPPDDASNFKGSPVTTAVLSLMGLVLAFTYSNAAGRLEASRLSILDEVNAIETAWLRIDVAEPEAQPHLRQVVRNYLDTRIRAYEMFREPAEYRRQLESGAELRKELWALSVEATTASVNRTLLLTALNALSDTATTRTLSLGTHLPSSVLVCLIGIVLIGSMLIGTMLGGPDNRRWFDRVVIAIVLSLVVYTILDMEYPRVGIKLLERSDAMLLELRKSIS
jgi:hypothetical protein